MQTLFQVWLILVSNSVTWRWQCHFNPQFLKVLAVQVHPTLRFSVIAIDRRRDSHQIPSKNEAQIFIDAQSSDHFSFIFIKSSSNMFTLYSVYN
jgi:hypothetical protein